MRVSAVALVVFALGALAVPRAVLAQGADALGSPWESGRGPADAPVPAEPPQDIRAEESSTVPGATPPAGGAVIVPGGASASGDVVGGVVVPEGYAPAVVPTPGVYPSGPPRTAPEDPLHLPSGIVTRLRALDADLQLLAARGGGSVLDGVLALIMGAASVTIGIILDEPVSGSPSPLSPYLYTYGSGMVVRGILDLALITNPGASSTTYTHMPMRTHREVRERLLYGEGELSHLADRAAISRYVDGGLNIALGLLIVPVYIAPNGFTDEDAANPFTYLMLLGAVVSVTSGLIAIFTTSEAERRWSAYSQLRDQLSSTVDGADDDAELEEAAGGGDLAAARPSVTGRLGLGGLSLDGTF